MPGMLEEDQRLLPEHTDRVRELTTRLERLKKEEVNLENQLRSCESRVEHIKTELVLLEQGHVRTRQLLEQNQLALRQLLEQNQLAREQRLLELALEQKQLVHEQEAVRSRQILMDSALLVALWACLLMIWEPDTLPSKKMLLKLRVHMLIAEQKPPYYLMFVFSLTSSIIEILVLGVLPMKRSGKASRVKFCASQAYQLYLVVALIFNIYRVVSKTCAFTLKSWEWGDPIAIVILNTLKEFALHLVAGPLLSDGCKIFALFQATIEQVKFARAHEKIVFRHPVLLHQGDEYVFGKLVEVNGPIFGCYLTMVRFGWRIGLMICALLAAPAFLAYCWFIVPIGLVLYALVCLILNLLLWCAFPEVTEEKRELIAMFDVEVTGLKEEEGDDRLDEGDNRHMEFIMGNTWWVPVGRTVQERYRRATSTLYNTNLTYSAWYIYLLVSVLMPMLVSFLVVLGVRLYSGFGYTEALTKTIKGERDLDLYVQTLRGSVVDAISAFTQAC